MIGPEGTDNCHKFVDILGLRTIFPLFMKSPRKIKKVGTTEKEHEGRVDCQGLWERRVNLFPSWQSSPEPRGGPCLCLFESWRFHSLACPSV